jgi:hypothetical protein
VIGDGEGVNAGGSQLLKKDGDGIGTVRGDGMHMQVNGACHGTPPVVFFYYSAFLRKLQQKHWHSP